jgi:quercetin dioxygenase-like cupin family protein
MVRPLLVFCGVLAFSALQVPLFAGSVQKLKNQKVSVTEDSLAPGQAETLSAQHPSMIVYLSNGAAEGASAQSETGKAQVQRGDTTFAPVGTKLIKNAGASELKFVRVEFLTSGRDETWGRTGMPPNYKILIENRYARAYDIRIAPHSFEQRHTHHDRVVVCLSGATLEHLLPNGEKQPSTLKTGEIVWRPGATHVGHNLGSTELWVIAIEPK